MDVIATVRAGFEAAKAYFGYATTRTEEKNREGVVKGAEAAAEQALQDKAAKAVANGDIEEIRKELAE